jgi:hypothetical protein
MAYNTLELSGRTHYEHVSFNYLEAIFHMQSDNVN